MKEIVKEPLVVSVIFLLLIMAITCNNYKRSEEKMRSLNTTPRAPFPTQEKISDEWCPDTLNAGAFEENIKEVSEENP